MPFHRFYLTSIFSRFCDTLVNNTSKKHRTKERDSFERRKIIFILTLFSEYFRNFVDSMIKGTWRLISEKSPSKALKSRCRWPLSTTIFDRKEARNSPDQFSNVLFLKIKNFPEDVLSSGQSVLREIQSLNLYPPPKRRKFPILKSNFKRWVSLGIKYREKPGTSEKKNFGYRWVLGTGQMKNCGYRLVLGTDQI